MDDEVDNEFYSKYGREELTKRKKKRKRSRRVIVSGDRFKASAGVACAGDQCSSSTEENLHQPSLKLPDEITSNPGVAVPRHNGKKNRESRFKAIFTRPRRSTIERRRKNGKTSDFTLFVWIRSKMYRIKPN